MKSFIDFNNLTEATRLGAPELMKPNSKTGEARTSILRSLIKKGEALELITGEKVKCTNVAAALKAITQFEKDGKTFSIHTQKGEIPISRLAKTAVFGGGSGGSGGGSAQTKNVESAQCLWCAALLAAGPDMPFEHFTNTVLQASAGDIDVDAKMVDMLNIDDQWKMSAYLTAQHLIRNGYITKGMKFHRGSRLMQGIYAAKNTAYKNQELKGMKDDKWNPGDIWACSSSFQLSELNSESVVSLQKSILKLFLERRLVGISLKLVKKQAKSKEYNVHIPPDVEDYHIKGWGAKSLKTDRGDFWTTKSGEVDYNDGKLLIKDNSAFGTIKAEILGKTARGGGSGWGYIATAAQQVFNLRLPGPKDIARMARKIEKGDTKEMKTMYDYVKEVEPMSFAEFSRNIRGKDAVWIHAKYGVCLFLYPLAKWSGQKANRFITKIINYAGSKTEDSSAYVKVYT